MDRSFAMIPASSLAPDSPSLVTSRIRPANPPDIHQTGQDISDLLSSVLRIDVDHVDDDRNYGIPADNPFVGRNEARGEIWAYGLRNPWRISFDRKTVTVTASGEPAVDASGNPQGWFDPAKPVTLRFTEIGGRDSEGHGLLPLHHAMVIGEKEHRFTVLPGDRGFVTVTQERCDYP